MARQKYDGVKLQKINIATKRGATRDKLQTA